MKIIHITDVHLVRPGERLFDQDPTARLSACLENVKTHHADAALCVLTGDLAHHGERAAYVALREQLETLPMPVRLLVGNHDDRSMFRHVFADGPTDENGFVQSVLDTPAGRLVFLDTNQPGTHAGWYCEARQEWLRARLAEVAGEPVYVFMHHPPFAVNYRPSDELMLMNDAAFASLVKGHAIRHLFFGHVHRPIAGSWRGIPFTTLRGLNHQVWLDFGLARGIPTSLEPPAYAIAFLREDAVVVHMHDFLDDSPKFFYDPDLPVEHQVTPMPRASECLTPCATTTSRQDHAPTEDCRPG